MALSRLVAIPRATIRSDVASMLTRPRYADRFVITGRRFCQKEPIQTLGQQTNTDLHRSLLDLRATRSCAERVLLAFGELRQTNIDLGLAGNARIVANAADPFDTPEQIVIRERINCVKSLAHWQIITESKSIKEPRGRSRSQKLFANSIATFAFISARSAHIRRYFWN